MTSSDVSLTVLTGPQNHVLRNIERVAIMPYKLVVRQPVRRYELDGVQCTHQVNSLAVRKLVAFRRDGTVYRSGPAAMFASATA